MKELTTKQKQAVRSLVVMLDELDNKPRRLYYELEKLAIAFDKTEAIPSIREAQDLMYKHINEGEHYEELFRSVREFKIEEWQWQVKNSPEDIDKSQIRIDGAERFVKLHINRLTERRF